MFRSHQHALSADILSDHPGASQAVNAGKSSLTSKVFLKRVPIDNQTLRQFTACGRAALAQTEVIVNVTPVEQMRLGG
jgi:hypothetical protein